MILHFINDVPKHHLQVIFILERLLFKLANTRNFLKHVRWFEIRIFSKLQITRNIHSIIIEHSPLLSSSTMGPDLSDPGHGRLTGVAERREEVGGTTSLAATGGRGVVLFFVRSSGEDEETTIE